MEDNNKINKIDKTINKIDETINKIDETLTNKIDETLTNNPELCCICYNDKLTLFLNCNHVICLECITNIKKLCCPLCRTELSYLPIKIINIINNNTNSTNSTYTRNNNNTNSYLSLMHNVVPLSLSSPNNLRYSLQPLTNFSPLQPSTNFSPLQSSTSLINNDLLMYEQYFNDLAFIDIDDIIHYGFINESLEGDGRNGDYRDSGSGDGDEGSRSGDEGSRSSDEGSRSGDGGGSGDEGSGGGDEGSSDDNSL
jgi:hypothetical protein